MLVSNMLATLLPGFAGTSLPVWLRDRLQAGLGGVCLFAQNISSPGQLRSLTDAILAANPYAIIAIDEEGGDVTRLFAATGAPFPGNAVLGRLDDLDTTRDTAAAIGWSLRRAGCTVNFAPCVDVNSRSDNPVIGVRSLSSDAERVARHGRAWVEGLQSTGVAASAKHFPGHGDTAQDSHVSLPVVSRSLDELHRRELLPFVAAIQAGCRLIMTSHILLPQMDPHHPATMSRIVLHDLLRGELGFSGVIVSDALDMAGASGSLGMAEAAVVALRAGCDLLCLGTENTDTQLDDIERAVGNAVADGTLGANRVREALRRVRGLAAELETTRQAAGEPPSSAPGWPQSEAELVDTFDVQPGAADWRARAAGGYAVVRLEANPNIAVGTTPWGPFAAAAAAPAAPAAAAFAVQPMCLISPERSALPPLEPSQPVLVIGRDIHQHPFAREAVDRLRSQHVDLLVVDMGWPSADRRYADVATFGASLLMGRALLSWLARWD
ncbi:MAG TPA: beta-N-acetylhexosaminidase [Propionibacteriaceae bacterium]|nr:beta-N-acetylhexosaminidase [Propionibacteriaceae bacterium]